MKQQIKSQTNQNNEINGDSTVQGWIGRQVHDGIVFTLGPRHLLRRTWWGRTRWQQAGSRRAAAPSLARPPNWWNNAAGHPGLPQWTLIPTCNAQKDMTQAQNNIMQQLNLAELNRWCHLSLFVDVSARALGSSSVFFLLIFLCLTVPLSDLPLGSSVKPLLVWG